MTRILISFRKLVLVGPLSNATTSSRFDSFLVNRMDDQSAQCSCVIIALEHLQIKYLIWKIAFPFEAIYVFSNIWYAAKIYCWQIMMNETWKTVETLNVKYFSTCKPVLCKFHSMDCDDCRTRYVKFAEATFLPLGLSRWSIIWSALISSTQAFKETLETPSQYLINTS